MLLTSRAMPTIVTQGSSGANRTCWPIGSALGQTAAASVSLITATGAVAAASSVPKNRPRTLPIPSAAK